LKRRDEELKRDVKVEMGQTSQTCHVWVQTGRVRLGQTG
jgi:hypothetical protein